MSDAAAAVTPVLPTDRWRAIELAFWLLPVAAFFLFPNHRVLGSQILITGLFAVTLDLILGYAGIVSLGHAAFFGIGAYAAGLLAVHGWGEPISGLVVAGAAGAVVGFATSFLVVRGSDLARLMVTLGIGLMLFEVANQIPSITGGADGLSGVTMGKVLGLFAFDLTGTTAYVYSLVVLFVLFVAMRRIVSSPFGLSLRGVRENVRRMPAIGAPVTRRLIAIYTVSAALAGVAGGLLAQTTQFVGLDVFGFPRSADLMIMLVLGGAGRLYGGLIGATVFMIAHHYLSDLNPVYWQFWLGTSAGRRRDVRARRNPRRARRTCEPVREVAVVTPALSTRGLSKHFGEFKANTDVTLEFPQGARHALIGPNGAGKTTLINLLTGVFPPTSGDVFLGGERITGLPQHQRVKRGVTRTFQINTLFAGLTVLESATLAVCERLGRAGVWHRTVAKQRAEADEALELLRMLGLSSEANTLTRDLPYGKQRLVEIALALATKPRILLLDEPAAGIPAGESAELFAVIAALPKDVTILFIEHDMELVFRFAERITVLVGGQVLTEGTPAEIAADPRVREVYLGEAQHG